MPESFHKFPSTPHLAWLGVEKVRGDKVMAPEEAKQFLASSIVVEEKLDGANLGLSFDSSGQLRFQNRGQWLKGKLTGQWERLRGWAAEHEAALRDHLPPGQILFGEWCYAKHSLAYDSLPDWFVAFDVYNGRAQQFWSTGRRDAFLLTTEIAATPQLQRGRFDLADLRDLLNGTSAFGKSQREGLYLRRENEARLVARAKLVHPDFTQAIGEHWSRHLIVPNCVRGTHGKATCRASAASLP